MPAGFRRIVRRLPWSVLQFAILAVAFGIHELLRGLVAGTTAEAMANGRGVIDLERSVGIFQELTLQRWALAHPVVMHFLDFAYLHFHMTALIIFVAWICIFHPKHVATLRYVFLITIVVAVPTYYFFPLAPPRFFPHVGFVDTVAIAKGASYREPTGLLANSFAAMPSLHAGWSLMIAIGVIRIKRRPVYWLALLYWFLTIVAIAATANHYFLDAIGGSVVTLAAYLTVPRLIPLLPWSVERRQARERHPVLVGATTGQPGGTARSESSAVSSDPD